MHIQHTRAQQIYGTLDFPVYLQWECCQESSEGPVAGDHDLPGLKKSQNRHHGWIELILLRGTGIMQVHLVHLLLTASLALGTTGPSSMPTRQIHVVNPNLSSFASQHRHLTSNKPKGVRGQGHRIACYSIGQLLVVRDHNSVCTACSDLGVPCSAHPGLRAPHTT